MDGLSKREAAVTTAKAVANFFLDRGKEEGIPIDQLKLQKLVFYAHAWHMAHGLGPLFPDDVEAWPHGPVIRDLYVEFHEYGKRPITSRAGYFDGKIVYTPEVSEDSGDTYEMLGAFWDKYKNFTGVELSNATHNPGEPWAIIKGRYGQLDVKPRIPNELIEQIFRAKLGPAPAEG